MLQVPTEERLGDDAAVAQAAGEHTEDERAEAQVWAPEESIDATAAAAAAEAATKKRKAKKPWICAACAKHHYERSAVCEAGGRQLCLPRAMRCGRGAARAEAEAAARGWHVKGVPGRVCINISV